MRQFTSELWCICKAVLALQSEAAGNVLGGPPWKASQTLLNSRKRHLLFLESGLAVQYGSLVLISPSLWFQRAPLHLCDIFICLLSSEFTGAETSARKWEKAGIWGHCALIQIPVSSLALCMPWVGKLHTSVTRLWNNRNRIIPLDTGLLESFGFACGLALFLISHCPLFIRFLVSGLHWIAAAMVTNDPTLF